MENTETTNVVSLDTLNANNLPELQGWKDKQLKLVEENPYIEIEDNKTYEVAKQRRTALLKGRTSLEAQDKLIASKLTSFRKDVKTATDELILITLPHEEKQQEEVKRFEQIKENERLERERLENERISDIKNKISELETFAYEIIQSITLDGAETDNHYVDEILNTDFDFEEFDILWQQAKLRIEKSLESKLNDLSEKAKQKAENERLAKEKAEADAKLEAIQKQQEKDRAEREEKEREEKEKVFHIRLKRFNDAGFDMGEGFEMLAIGKLIVTKDDIYNSDVIDFENLLTDAKNALDEFRSSQEKERYNKRKLAFESSGFVPEENITQFYFPKSDLHISMESLFKEIDDIRFKELLSEFIEGQKEAKKAEELALKKKAEKENKERVKRLAKDKETLKKEYQKCFNIFVAGFASNNTEITEFVRDKNKEFTQFTEQLLTELENL